MLTTPEEMRNSYETRPLFICFDWAYTLTNKRRDSRNASSLLGDSTRRNEMETALKALKGMNADLRIASSSASEKQ